MEDVAVKEFECRRGQLLLLPYCPGIGAYTEYDILSICDRLKKEGLWDSVFHENPDMTPAQVLNFFNNPRNLLQIFSLTDDEKIVDIVGMAWLSDIIECQGIMTKGIGSFVFFRDYQKPEYTSAFGQWVIDYWFSTLKMDCVFGITPATNRAALLYVKRCGLKEVARIPGYTTLKNEIVDGVVTRITREEHLSSSVI
jgi:RimJ/RimL family protein N-acetyltransferase